MNKFALLLSATALLSLSACGTLNGAGMDFQNWGSWLDRTFGDDNNTNENMAADNNAFQDNQGAPVRIGEPAPVSEPLSLRAAADCPQIKVPPMLSTLIEFQDPTNPQEAQRIATSKITNVQSRCTRGGDFVTVSLDLNFMADLGPKAKRNTSDKPYFSFPYYIAVKDYNGTELAREVFAASFAFDDAQTQKATLETVEQNLPINAAGMLPNYKMEVGFQLSDEQMSYNNNARTFF